MGVFLIIDCGSSKVPKIEEAVSAAGQECVTIEPSDIAETELRIPMYSGIIISGAPILLTEVESAPYLQQFSPILNWSLPILGICFGHQILGMLHGAEVYRCDESRTDLDIEIKADHFLFENTSTTFNEDHCEAISVPEGWTNLASSSICQNEAMAHPSAPYYGVQFHPETSGTNGFQLLKNFCISCLPKA